MGLTGYRSYGGGSGPLLSLNYVSGTLDGTTLTRSSSATFFNSSGVLTSAATDVARFDYEPVSLSALGLLVEPSRTNLFLQSDNYASTSWTKQGALTITSSFASSPRGASTATKVTVPTSPAFHAVRQLITTTSAGQIHSAIVKNGGYNFACLTISNGIGYGQSYQVVFNLTTGAFAASAGSVFSGTYGSVSLGDGWFLLWVAVTNGYVGAGAVGDVLPFSSASQLGTQWAGNGTDGILLAGSQFEHGSSVSTYIPTTTASVTRSADVATITIPSGVSTIRYTFDNDTTQDVSVTAGSYTIPTNLNRSRIKTIVSI